MSHPCHVKAVGKLSREEFRRQRDLDAARKAGTAPAALDEEGKPINPHIPRTSFACLPNTVSIYHFYYRIYLPSTLVLGYWRTLLKPSTPTRL